MAYLQGFWHGLCHHCDVTHDLSLPRSLHGRLVTTANVIAEGAAKVYIKTGAANPLIVNVIRLLVAYGSSNHAVQAVRGIL